MKLLDYVKSLPAPERESFARRCKTTVDYLLQVGYGNRRPKIDLVVRMERESAGAVSCEESLPDLDWSYLRGDSISRHRVPQPEHTA